MNELEIFMWIGIPFAIVWALVCREIGKTKGMENLATWYGILLGAFGILVTVLSRGDRINCMYCQSLISPKATICPRCGRRLY